MNTQILKRLPTLAAVAIVVLVVAACAIRPRGDEEPTKMSASADAPADPLTAKLAECRSVTYEQKDAFSECRKAWAEKRRQFLGQKAPSTSADTGTSQEGSSLFVPPADASRLPSGFLQHSGKE
jgi:conjugative transfer region protein TrbK